MIVYYTDTSKVYFRKEIVGKNKTYFYFINLLYNKIVFNRNKYQFQNISISFDLC